ncbi:hypothetical protein J6590_038040 [Homalodisca vitripennis]|nr:hypothetical protein J6590_038040 [Homalodisca vitripennis]
MFKFVPNLVIEKEVNDISKVKMVEDKEQPWGSPFMCQILLAVCKTNFTEKHCSVLSLCCSGVRTMLDTSPAFKVASKVLLPLALQIYNTPVLVPLETAVCPATPRLNIALQPPYGSFTPLNLDSALPKINDLSVD